MTHTSIENAFKLYWLAGVGIFDALKEEISHDDLTSTVADPPSPPRCSYYPRQPAQHRPPKRRCRQSHFLVTVRSSRRDCVDTASPSSSCAPRELDARACRADMTFRPHGSRSDSKSVVLVHRLTMFSWGPDIAMSNSSQPHIRQVQ